MRPSAADYKIKSGDKKINVLECEVWGGKNARDMYDNMNINIMYLVDRWHPHYENYNFPDIKQRAIETFERFEDMDDVIIIRANSLKFDLFPDGYFDYIYLDDDHTFEQVTKELELYWDKLKPGGALAGDNYEQAGVSRAVNTFSALQERELFLKPWKTITGTDVQVQDWWFYK